MRQRISNKSGRCSYKPKIRALVFLCFLGLCFIYLPSQLYAAHTETNLTASDGAAYDYFGNSVAVSGDTAVVGAFLDDDKGTNSGSAYVYRFDGSTWSETKLTASDGAAYDYFGGAVAVSGNTVVVGANYDDDKGTNSGSAYVYRFDGSTWSETKLTASDGAAYDYFGGAVAVSGDTVVVGALGDDNNGTLSGSAYVFRYVGSTWLETKLTASDGAAYDYFGNSVAVSGDTVVVGALLDDDKGTNSGSAYVYRFDGSTWPETKLTASDGAARDYFGMTIAVSGNMVVVGTPYDDDKGTNSGSAYVYRFDGSTWLETKLTTSDGAASDYFGYSIAVSGDTVVVGAVGDDNNGPGSGSAYVFRYVGSTWQKTNLTASDGAAYDNFGKSVAVSGNTVIVGAYGDDDKGTNSGSAYVYRFDGSTWQETKLIPSDGAAWSHFGKSVAVSGNTVVVGAPYDDDNGLASGSAYVYRFDGSTWPETKLTASDGAAGDNFGKSVAVSSNNVVVGAPFAHNYPPAHGAAYVYRFDGSPWPETKLTVTGGPPGKDFGNSVAVSGFTLVVGAPHDDGNGLFSGSAYVYGYVLDLNNPGGMWWQAKKLTASDGAVGDNFGKSVAVSGNTVIVGAPWDDDNGPASGSAYVYRHAGMFWPETKLTASDGAAGSHFGNSVAVSGDTVVVGAFLDDDKGTDSGSAYVYRFDGSTWQETKLTASDGAAWDFFGASVAVSGDTVVVGAPHDFDNGPGSGAAYVYRFDGSTWPETKLIASDGAAWDSFGASVAVSGDTVVVGTPGDNDNGLFSGSAYVYEGAP